MNKIAQPTALELRLKQKKEMHPQTGFNLIGLDDFEAPGEELYLIDNFSTEADALAVQAKRKVVQPEERTFIYGPKQ